MKRFRIDTLILLAVPFLAVALITAGCTGTTKKEGAADGTTSKDGKEGKGKGTREALEIKDRGTLTGKVTVDGGTPSYTWPTDKLQAEMKKKDEAHCLTGASEEEKSQYEWKIDPDTKGLAGVIVWLNPPSGKYFKLDEKIDIDPAKGEKDIDQPHCAFVPHALTLFPTYCGSDGKTQKPTGQKFFIKNSAQINHNSKYEAPPLVSGKNLLLKPNEKEEVTLKASARPQHLTIVCDIHPWMKANAWILEHPFAAVTGKDGSYEIKNVPAGVPLKIVAWHPKALYINEKGQEGEDITIKAGVTKDFKTKAK